jgi:DNA replication protein DnaC
MMSVRRLLPSYGSIIVTRNGRAPRNLPFDEWTNIFGSERLTHTLLDRLTQHVHILEMNGESHRLADNKNRL